MKTLILMLLIGSTSHALSCKTANETLSSILYHHPDTFDVNEIGVNEDSKHRCNDWREMDQGPFEDVWYRDAKSDFVLYKALCKRLERCK